jgi:hypothetical protein
MEWVVLERFDFGFFAAGLSNCCKKAYNEHMSTQNLPMVIPDIEIMHPIVAQILRQKTPAERLALASGMRKSVTKTLQAFLRSEHPTWTDEQIQSEIARRIPLGNR